MTNTTLNLMPVFVAYRYNYTKDFGINADIIGVYTDKENAEKAVEEYKYMDYKNDEYIYITEKLLNDDNI